MVVPVVSARFRAETVPVDPIDSLVELLDRDAPLLWLRERQGIIGIGEALRLEFRGPDRITDAAAAWRELERSSIVADPLDLPGTGLVAFGTFAFADDSDTTSVLIIPTTVIGRIGTQHWITRITALPLESATEGDEPYSPEPDFGYPVGLPDAQPLGARLRVHLTPGDVGEERYRRNVRSGLEAIAAGALSKLVLARDVHGELPTEGDGDLRRILLDLAVGYPGCWTFSVDGLVGASPETLIRSHHGAVSARVLAGTAARGRDLTDDLAVAETLSQSPKDLAEHAWALESVRSIVAEHVTGLAHSPRPFTLKLPNLWHLASDVSGTLAEDSSALDLVAALHPTAAVAGTPRAEALAAISSLEQIDRGRYAGPVGWVGAGGSGEWAIALRSAEITVDAEGRGHVRAIAGAGIVAGSDPDSELRETGIKLRPMTEAFGDA